MSISKVNVSGADHQIVGSPRYATCSTAAATAAKVATIADGSSTFSLEKGARICVSFTYANTASAATLNVASTGAKAICWQGSALVSSQYWQAGAVVDFVYDGNGWSIVGIAKDNNSTNFLPLSGGSLTGNLTVGSSSIGTNGYIEGTWLKTTKATESAGNFATISDEGWIYKRKPTDVLGDIGGQAKITANGFLKGDGTGIIAADKPVFWVTVTQNTTDNLYSADKTYSEIIEAYNNGYMVQAKYSVDDGTNKEIYSLMSTYRSGSVKMLYFIYLNDHEEKRFTCRVTATAEKWLYKESSLVPSNLTINNKPLSSNITLTPSDINAQSKITANGILKGDGAGNITAADETEVELVDITPESIGAQPKIIANGFLTSDGEGNVGAEKPVFFVVATSSGSGEETTIDSVDKTVAEIVTAYQNGYSVVLKLNNDSHIFHLEYVSSDSYKSVNFTCFDTDRYTKYDIQGSASSGSASDSWYYYITNLFRDKEYIKIKNKRILDAVQDLQNMIKIKSISLPTASWAGSDPYTQTISISGTEKTQASIQLSDTLYDQLVTDKVTYLNIENNNGVFTAKAKGGKPSVNLTVQVTCTETT